MARRQATEAAASHHPHAHQAIVEAEQAEATAEEAATAEEEPAEAADLQEEEDNNRL